MLGMRDFSKHRQKIGVNLQLSERENNFESFYDIYVKDIIRRKNKF